MSWKRRGISPTFSSSTGVPNCTAPIVLQNTTDVDASAQSLVETALGKGARDNVTALVVRYEGDR